LNLDDNYIGDNGVEYIVDPLLYNNLTSVFLFYLVKSHRV
jgi:hypothetical protein